MVRATGVHSGPLPRLTVALLLGGVSEEREVSLASGAAVEAALLSRGHRVRRIDPGVADLSTAALRAVDVVFNCLHGRFGEDGDVQEILERARVPYTGSNAAASRVAFSKSAAKRQFLAAGVPTAAFQLIHRGDSPLDIEAAANRLGYPLVAKPDQQGSSLGVSIVRTPRELPEAVETCWTLGAAAVLETCIAGTEWTVPLLDREPLPVIQIVPPAAFFDYHSKYVTEETAYRFEFDVPACVVAAIREAAIGAAAAVGAEGISRVDLRLDESHHPWVLEVNTSPGMTDHSLTPKSAGQAGLSLGDLCEEALRRALRRGCLQHEAAA